jgi:hypothetical protein
MSTIARVIVPRLGGTPWAAASRRQPRRGARRGACANSHVAAAPQGAVVLLIANGLLSLKAREVSLHPILWPAVGLRAACNARMRPQDSLGLTPFMKLPLRPSGERMARRASGQSGWEVHRPVVESMPRVRTTWIFCRFSRPCVFDQHPFQRPHGLLIATPSRLVRSASVHTGGTDVMTLLVQSRRSISNAMGVRFSRGMSLVSLTSKRRM